MPRPLPWVRRGGGHLGRVQGDDDGLEVEEQQCAHARIPQQPHARVDAARGTTNVYDTVMSTCTCTGMRIIDREFFHKVMLLDDGERQMAAGGACMHAYQNKSAARTRRETVKARACAHTDAVGDAQRRSKRSRDSPPNTCGRGKEV